MNIIFNKILIVVVLPLFSSSVFSNPNVCLTGSPELHTNITDYQNASYKIVTVKLVIEEKVTSKY
ncbi:MAG TPA: hypothetical protein PKA80_15465 [Ignavibacteriaceae bacterium]|nr:hypothetical protein [Ignavibacteriaceae bacterium]